MNRDGAGARSPEDSTQIRADVDAGRNSSPRRDHGGLRSRVACAALHRRRGEALAVRREPPGLPVRSWRVSVCARTSGYLRPTGPESDAEASLRCSRGSSAALRHRIVHIWHLLRRSLFLQKPRGARPCTHVAPKGADPGASIQLHGTDSAIAGFTSALLLSLSGHDPPPRAPWIK